MTIGVSRIDQLPAIARRAHDENFGNSASIAQDLNNGAAAVAATVSPGNESLPSGIINIAEKSFPRAREKRTRKSRRLLAFVGLAYIPITRIKTSVLAGYGGQKRS